MTRALPSTCKQKGELRLRRTAGREGLINDEWAHLLLILLHELLGGLLALVAAARPARRLPHHAVASVQPWKSQCFLVYRPH